MPLRYTAPTREAGVPSLNQHPVAPTATTLGASISTHHHDVEQQQPEKTRIPQYHINGLELTWDLKCAIIPAYPIHVIGIKGTANQDTVMVEDRAGLHQLIKDVKRRQCKEFLVEKGPLDEVSIFDGLGPWEKEWVDMYEECEECEEGDDEDEDKDTDMGEDVDVGAQVFIQVDVDSATNVAVYYNSESDADMEVDEEVNLEPCVGAQYVWRV